jgi:hypothetical protein
MIRRLEVHDRPVNPARVTSIIGEYVMTRKTDDLMATGTIASFLWYDSELHLFSIPYAPCNASGEMACVDLPPSGSSPAMGEIAVIARTCVGRLRTSGLSSFIWNNQENLTSFTACLRVASTWCDMSMPSR